MSDEKKKSLREIALLSEQNKKYDPEATAESCISDLRRLQKEFPLKHLTRNFYRANGIYSEATWNQFFGTFLEFRRQAKLELSRNQHSMERKIAKHASLDEYRNFYKSEVLPYHGKYERIPKQKKGRYKTMLVGSDFHDIDCDPFVLSVFIDTAKRLQPDVIVLNGDVFDLYEFSRFFKDPRHIKIKERFDYVKKYIFGGLREACPRSQIDLCIGNHDYRILHHLADKTPAMKVILADVMGLSMADVFGLDEYEINLVAKLDLHAFNAADITDQINQNYRVYYSTFVCGHFKDLSLGLSGTSGHTHKPELVFFRNIPMGRMTWANTGCMARIRAEYVGGVEKFMNSFLIATVDTEKRLVIPNPILVPGDTALVEGKLYERTKLQK